MTNETKATGRPWVVTAEPDGTLRVRFVHEAYPAGERLGEEAAASVSRRLNGHGALLDRVARLEAVLRACASLLELVERPDTTDADREACASVAAAARAALAEGQVTP